MGVAAGCARRAPRVTSVDGMAETAWRGELRWNVKASFVAYVRGSSGRIETSCGAREEDGEFVFDRGVDGLQIDDGTPRGVAKFSGAVRFTAHGGLLDLRIADPRIEFGPHLASLAVTGTDGGALELATLDVGGALERDGVLEWIGVLPMLTPDGAAAFNGVYPAYSELDAMSFRLAP